MRLEAVTLHVTLGDGPRAVQVLRDGLRESPREESVVAKLTAVLEADGRLHDLEGLFEEQARLAEDAADRSRAAELWLRAARLAEDRLHDPATAATLHERVVALEPRGESFEALARLASE